MRTIRLPLTMGLSTSRSVVMDNQLLDNLYANKEEEGARHPFTLHSTPGTKTLFTSGTGPSRANGANFNQKGYMVSGSSVLEIDMNFSATSIGTLQTTDGVVSLIPGRTELLILDGTAGYTWDGTTFRTIDAAAGVPLTGTVTFNNGSTAVTGSGTAFTSEIVAGDTIWLDADGVGAAQTVDSIASDTALTLDTNYGGAAASPGASHVFYDENDFQTGQYGSFINGRFVLAKPASDRYQYSASNVAGRWPALNFASAQSNGDRLLNPIQFRGDLWNFGEFTMESNFPTNTVDKPFAVYPGGLVEWGTVAPSSVAKIGHFVFFLSQNEKGNGVVMRFSDVNPVRISNFAIEWTIRQLSNISDAEAFCYQDAGHEFYVLTFPAAKKTLVFDNTTGVWHQRSSVDQGRWRVRGHLFFNKKHIVGDFNSNQFYELDLNTFTDNDGDIFRTVRTAVYHDDQDYSLHFYNVTVDVESGQGLQTGSGSDPQMYLDVYKEGKTRLTSLPRSMGKIGEVNKRLIWRKLGTRRHTVFEFRTATRSKVIIGGLWARIGENLH